MADEQNRPRTVMDELRVVKVLVMVEIEPLTDHFHQLMLTPEKGKKVRDAIAAILGDDGNGNFNLTLNNKVCVKLKDVVEDYPPAEFTKNRGPGV